MEVFESQMVAVSRRNENGTTPGIFHNKLTGSSYISDCMIFTAYIL